MDKYKLIHNASWSKKISEIILGVFLDGGSFSAVIEDLSENGAVKDGGDDVVDDGKQIARLDPRRRDPHDAAEKEETHRDGRQLTGR